MSTDKNFHIIANNLELYDREQYVNEAVSVFAAFVKHTIAVNVTAAE